MVLQSSYHTHKLIALRKLGLSTKTIGDIVSYVNFATSDAGEVIIKKGDVVESWNLLIKGLASASLKNSQSTLTPIHIFGPESWFGEHSIINGKTSYADYIALTNLEMLMMPSVVFKELIATEPDFYRKILEIMAWRLQKTSELLALTRLGNSNLRVVVGLSQLAEALNYQSERPPTIGFGYSIRIPVKQQVMAALFSVSRTTLSSTLQTLSGAGYLKMSYGYVEIISPNTWHLFNRLQREKRIPKFNPTIEELIDELASVDSLEGA